MISPGLLTAIEAVASARKTFKKKQLTRKLYLNYVHTYHDLLVTNLAFFHGKLRPFYYGGDALNPEHAESVSTLIELHEYGVMTDDGQGNACEPDYRETSYVSGVIPKHLLTALLRVLDGHSTQMYYTVMETLYPTTLVTNFTPDVFCNTNARGEVGYSITQGMVAGSSEWVSYSMVYRDRLQWPAMLRSATTLPTVFDLLSDTCTVRVYGKHFCSPFRADAFLLDVVKAAGFAQQVQDPFKRGSLAGGGSPVLLEPGDLLRFKGALGLHTVYHYGVYIGDGLVTHMWARLSQPKASAKVETVTMEDFMKLASKRKEAVEVERPPARLSPREVVRQSEMLRGQGGYHVLVNNCEHVARYCSTGQKTSEQLNAVFGRRRGSTVPTVPRAQGYLHTPTRHANTLTPAP